MDVKTQKIISVLPTFMAISDKKKRMKGPRIAILDRIARCNSIITSVTNE